MEEKLVKFKTHPGTFSKEELIVNIDALSKEKEKVSLVAGDIIELSVPPKQDASNSSSTPLVLQVENLPPELHSKGVPLSVNKDLAHTFGFEGAREVKLRKVNREEVGLDLVELRFKDQALTRSDMWRFSCSLMEKCAYVTKRVEFGGMRCQVSGLWSQGEQVQSGAVVDETRVVFRSASSHVFIFIQISSEMWDFDSSGDLYFDKAEGGFLQELFQRWNAEQCSHEVTLAFFWRAYYKRTSLDMLPPEAVIHCNKRGNNYEDFYKVIIHGESMADWSSRLVDIKKHFLHLQDFMEQTRGKDAVISHASEGNLLEAINLAVNVYENSFQNCNFQLTGQQIVLVTPGVGVFEVERELTMMTRERIIDSGVGVDLVSLSQQPLHAVPLFKFFSQSAMDNQEYYNLPHWINYSFYNPVHPWNQFCFQPMLSLSDHLINLHLNKSGENGCGVDHAVQGLPYQPSKEAGLVPHTLSSTENLQRNRLFNKYLVNHDHYDAAIFCSKEEGILGKMGTKGGSMPKVHSVGQMATSPAGRQGLGDQFSSEGTRSQGVMFEIPSSPEDDPFLSDPVSPPSDIKLSAICEDVYRDVVAAHPSRGNNLDN